MRTAQPSPADFERARQYVDGCIATQERYTRQPVGVSEDAYERAVLEVAKWTAKMRRLAQEASR